MAVVDVGQDRRHEADDHLEARQGDRLTVLKECETPKPRSIGVRVLLVEPAFTRTALDHIATKPDRMVSVYDQARATINAVWNSAIGAGDAPEVVGQAAVIAATAKSPKNSLSCQQTGTSIALPPPLCPRKSLR